MGGHNENLCLDIRATLEPAVTNYKLKIGTVSPICLVRRGIQSRIKKDAYKYLKILLLLLRKYTVTRLQNQILDYI
jgi:hypothetical protein